MKTVPTIAHVSPGLARDLRMLAGRIGERPAGSAAERRAARFIADRFSALGLSSVRLEEFHCRSLVAGEAVVAARKSGRWRNVPAAPLVGAPGTPGGRTIGGELTWCDAPEGLHRLRRGSLRGRILALFGPLPTTIAGHRRLLAADPLAVIHLDERLPFAWVKHDGVYPYWARRFGMPPTLAVPYQEAWRWRRDGVNALKVKVRAIHRDARSQNVIAELPGLEPAQPALMLTAHHDTQRGNPGADDNASGVACLLALAERLPAHRHRRTIRFISFGAEEQLSVGAAAHVRRHRPAPRTTGLVLNFDSVASPLGHFQMSAAGFPALARHAAAALARAGLDVVPVPEITPFGDQFPFNRAGIPSLWFMRANFSGGRWQHHSAHDTLHNVSRREIQRLVDAVGPLIGQLADAVRWPFPPGLPAAQRRRAARLGAELFG